MVQWAKNGPVPLNRYLKILLILIIFTYHVFGMLTSNAIIAVATFSSEE